MRKLTFVTLLVHFAFVSQAFTASDDLPILTEIHQKITAEFSRLDSGLKDTAIELGAQGLTGDSARSSLSELCGKFTFAVDCSAVDPKGIMVTMEPAPYRHFEGTDISAQEQVRGVIAEHKPVMSSVFKAIEGFDAVDVEYPVFNSQREYMGSVSLFFKPETFFAEILPPLIKGIPVGIWVMEKGGKIIYDTDSSQIGLNLFTSPNYQSYSRLQKLGRLIAAKQEGSGSYRYKVLGEKIAVTKDAFWKSVDLYGTEWRIVGVHARKDKSGCKMKQQPLSINPVESLDTFVNEGKLARILSKGDKHELMLRFKTFYKTTPEIYAIEWIDESGVNRFGYPTGNSLVDYDYHQKRETGDQEILDILANQKKASMELPLTEGGAGIFNFVPVRDGDHFLGLVYIIRLK